MFGYITVNEKELKIREYELYRSYYCGFCRELKRKYGFTGQMTLSYDMTFLIMLLCDLYDCGDTLGSTRCIAHPFISHPTRINEMTDYAADMNLILSYYSGMDDWNDEHELKKLAFAKLIHGKAQHAGRDYGRKAALVLDRLQKLHCAETQGSTDLDEVSGTFGDIMAEMFAVKEDEWEAPLRRMGFFLGKFIYLCDAYDDLDDDLKKGNYNPFVSMKDRPDYEENVHKILTMMMAQCCEAFETLPLVENVSILRNILYSGVWTRYNAHQAAKSGPESGR